MRLNYEEFGIISTWTNDGYDGPHDQGIIRWLCDYAELEDLELEQKRFRKRAARLTKKFKKQKIPRPVIDLSYGLDSLSPKTLTVFSIYEPEVTEDMLRPTVELRRPGMTPEEAQEYLVRKVMKVGTTCIKKVYGSIMHQSAAQ